MRAGSIRGCVRVRVRVREYARVSEIVHARGADTY